MANFHAIEDTHNPGIDPLFPQDNFGAVESVKAASDIYSPVGGSILEKNDALLARFALLNEDPEGAGYIAKLKVEQTAELDDLMDRKSYDEFCRGIGSDQKD